MSKMEGTIIARFTGAAHVDHVLESLGVINCFRSSHMSDTVHGIYQPVV